VSLAEFSVTPGRVLVHDPVAAGAFRALEAIRDPAVLERDWLFRKPPDPARYAEQHGALVRALQPHVAVLHLADLIADHEAFACAGSNPNLVFTRDSIVTLPWAPDRYLAARMKPALRRPETGALRAALERLGLRELPPIPEGLFLEGGDVIPFEREGRRTLLIGHGPRTRFETIEHLQGALLPRHADEILAIELAPWRMNLDGGLVPVTEDVVLAEPPSLIAGLLLDARSRQPVDALGLLRDLGMHVIETTREESVHAQACNCVCLGGRRIVYYDLCPRVAELLHRHDVETILVPGSELVKGRGGPRCMTRPIYRRVASPQ
jgi:N-dimethylarginine dimethylaminohydrolase